MAGNAPQQADWALGTRQAIGIHRAAGRQCADMIEAGVSADSPNAYIWVREVAVLGGQKVGTWLPMYARLHRQNC